ncbi:MAG: Na/Pi cotransporter family protein [Lachnospiraceae bacterium]|uniref:Na/Pi cotransporter family protein n=1 Tax=Candidatus Weimeria bifida TaxID=2599074 RepID=A0A6N7IWK5_9FIRM|nr:Na/Pi cotransporter family protein [Candidatus Weimeria bifida]RRF95687.1 MAG: Na/Pi cotransporter family protein [Lachnospiraceae bacterium]
MNIIILLKLISGLVLFLYGIEYLGEALKKVSGGKLEKILEGLTNNKWKAALLGTLVTCIIQSSGATIVMCVGFVNSGIMSLEQSVGVILGANIGTTITAWLLSLSGIKSDMLLLQLFKPENFSPVIGLIGLIMLLSSKKEKRRNVGAILLSFAILLIGMSGMSSAVSPLAKDKTFTSVLTMFSNPFLGLLVGLGMTAILQSSSASIGILQALSTSGTVTFATAIPIIMGENIGSAITGIISSVNASRNAKRASWMQMIYCIIKTSVFMVGFYVINAFVHFSFMSKLASPVSIAVFHSLFNITAVLIMLPFSDILIKIVRKLFPITEDEKKEAETNHTFTILDDRFLSSPAFALDQSKKVLLEMMKHSRDAMDNAIDLIYDYDERKVHEVSRLESLVDEYEDHLNDYLSKVAATSLSDDDGHTLASLLHSTNDFERISDHALNIMQSVEAMHENDVTFSGGALEEMHVFTDAISEILTITDKSLRENDIELAKRIDPLEDTIDKINLEINDHHVARLQSGECTVEQGLYLSDIMVDLERVADHCSNIAAYELSAEDNNFEVHELSQREREARNDSFRLLEDGYRAKYQLPEYKYSKKKSDKSSDDDSDKKDKKDKKKKKKK